VGITGAVEDAMSMNEAQTQAAIAAQQEALAAPAPAAPAPATQAAPYGKDAANPFGKGNEEAYTGKGTQTQSQQETETPSKGLDLSNLSMEFSNPNLGLLGALSPAENTGQTMGGQTYFDPKTGTFRDARTGAEVDPGGVGSLFGAMALGGRGGL
jgi:hypothetical protein